jgi:hypothetical protein
VKKYIIALILLLCFLILFGSKIYNRFFLTESERYWQNIVELSESGIKDIRFNGKVIDQYNNPISNVNIKFTGSRNTYARGSGPGTIQTNDQGEFEINDSKGDMLSIDKLSKQGYQINSGQQFYPGYSSAPQEIEGRPLIKSWADYTQSNPYIFKAWKIERYPKVAQSSSFAGFEPEIIYTLDFLKKHKLKQDLLEGDIKVVFKQSGDAWQLELSAIDGGMQITEDMYLNWAPDSGYQEKMVFRGDRKNRFMNRVLYFTSRNQTVYGLMKLGIYGFYREDAAIKIEYVVNLEQGQNLTVKKKTYDR